MSDKKYTLEDILNEYSPDRSKVKYSKKSMPDVPTGKLDTQQMLSDTANHPTDLDVKKDDNEEYSDNRFEPASPSEVNEVIETVKQKNHEKRMSEKPLKPVHNIQPDNLLRSRISFVNSAAMREENKNVPQDTVEPYDEVVVKHDETPSTEDTGMSKIRKMEDSTRAKEIRKKKKNKRFRSKSEYDYQKETPEGAYTDDTYAEESKKRQQKSKYNDGKYIPFAEESDIVEVKESKRKKRRVADSDFDIHSFSDSDGGDALDISIEENHKIEEEKKKRKKKKAKEKSEKYYEDAEPDNKKSIQKDINSLKSVIASRIFILAALAALSVFISASNHFHLAVYDSLVEMITQRGVSLLHTLLGVGAIFAAFPTVKYGIRRLFTFRSDCDTMPAAAIICSVISSALIAFTPDLLEKGLVHLFMPVAIVMLMVNTFGKLLILNRASKNIRFISNDFNWYTMKCVENEKNASTLTRGLMNRYPVLASMRKTSYLTDFLNYTYSSDVADRYCRKASPVFVILSILTTAGITFLKSGNMTIIELFSFAFSILTSLIILTGCMGVTLVVNIPLADATKKFNGRDGAVLGYQGVEDFYDTNSVLLNANQIFTSGSVKLGGIKIISDIQMEENLFAAASLVNYSGSVLKDVFANEIVSSDNKYYNVNNFKYEDNFGICGWINNKRILLGSREMMINHNIEGLPSKSKEESYCKGNSEAVYLAVAGNLAALFIIEFSADKKTRKYLEELEKNNIKIVMKTVDFFVTTNKLSTLYAISDGFIRVIPESLHSVFDGETEDVEKTGSSVLCSGRLSSISRLITGIRHIRQASQIGVSIQLISAILGFLIGVIYIVMGAFPSITASLLFIYQLLFTVITVFVAKLRKI